MTLVKQPTMVGKLPFLMQSFLVSVVQMGTLASPLCSEIFYNCLVYGWLLVGLVKGTEVGMAYVTILMTS